jgi:peptidyl-prolyl cis-trans isomerase A (cyclophilin A)
LEPDVPSTQSITLHTTAGDITVELFGNHAPKTVANFVELATGAKEWTDPRTGQKTRANLYDGTIFHRVIDNFMIQGGDPLGRGTGGPGYTFADEFHPELSFDRPYLMAMANAGPNTNGSQFFITTTPTPHLNHRHTIFGEVADADSRAVADIIGRSATSHGDRPVSDIVIQHVSVKASPEPIDQIAVTLIEGRLRIINVTEDGTAEYIDPAQRYHSLLYVWSLEADELAGVIRQFEDLINQPDVREHDLQQYLERNPSFLAGSEYQSAHPHIILRREGNASDLIPDFALRPHNADELSYLLELKLPKARVLAGPPSRRRFSAAVAEACAQLREYRDYFESDRNRNLIHETYGLKFFRPRMYVIIGRRRSINPIDLRKAEGDVPHLRLATYDDIVERAHARLHAMRTGSWRF